MNLENGMYIKAVVCGVSSREFVLKDGSIGVAHNLVLEENPLRQKIILQFSKKQIADGLHKKIEPFINKTCFIPFYVVANNGYINYYYGSNNFPVIVNQAQKSE